jgi:hypothetical protein
MEQQLHQLSQQVSDLTKRVGELEEMKLLLQALKCLSGQTKTVATPLAPEDGFTVKFTQNYQTKTPSWPSMAKYVKTWIEAQGSYARGSTWITCSKEHIDVSVLDEKEGTELNFRLMVPTPKAYQMAFDAIVADLYREFSTSNGTPRIAKFDQAYLQSLLPKHT